MHTEFCGDKIATSLPNCTHASAVSLNSVIVVDYIVKYGMLSRELPELPTFCGTTTGAMKGRVTGTLLFAVPPYDWRFH